MKAIVTMLYDDGQAETYTIPARSIQIIDDDVSVRNPRTIYRFNFDCERLSTPFGNMERAYQQGVSRQEETSRIAVDNVFGPGAYDNAMSRLKKRGEITYGDI